MSDLWLRMQAYLDEIFEQTRSLFSRCENVDDVYWEVTWKPVLCGIIDQLKAYLNEIQNLGAEKELYREVLALIPYPLLLLDADEKISVMNYAAFSFIQNVVGSSFSYPFPLKQFLHLNDILPDLSEQLHIFLDSGEKERTAAQVLTGADLSQHNVLVSYYRLRNKEGVYTGTFMNLEPLTEHNEIEAKLRYMSFHDALTTLFNRAYFEEELKRLESGRYDPVGIISLDVDGLKIVNDILGHQAGDALLVTAGRLIRGCFRDSDVVARIGGDEFVVLLPQSSAAVVERAVERLKDAVENYNRHVPFSPVSISQGWAVRSDMNTSLSKVYQEADYKMYQQKPWNREAFLEKFNLVYKRAADKMYLNEKETACS